MQGAQRVRLQRNELRTSSLQRLQMLDGRIDELMKVSGHGRGEYRAAARQHRETCSHAFASYWKAAGKKFPRKGEVDGENQGARV